MSEYYNSNLVSSQKLLIVSDNYSGTDIALENSIYESLVKNDILDYVNPEPTNITQNNIYLSNDLMILNQNPEIFGETWALRAEHNFNDTPDASYTEFTTVIGDLSHNLFSQTVTTNTETTSYYDATLKFNFYDGQNGSTTNEAKKIMLSFDESNDLSYNSFKAVNSYLNRSDYSDSIIYSENDVWNSQNALLTEQTVLRDSSGQLYLNGYDPSLNFISNYGVTIDLSQNAFHTNDNDNILIGSLKIYLNTDDVIDVYRSETFDLSNSTIVTYDASNLLQNYTESQFLGLFTSTELQYVAPKYTFDISANTRGGYSVDSSYIQINDDYIERNTEYMKLLSDDANDFADSSHNFVITNGQTVLTTNANSNANISNMLSISSGPEFLGSVDSVSNGYVNFSYTKVNNYVQGSVNYPVSSMPNAGQRADLTSSNINDMVSVYYDASEIPQNITGINTLSQNNRLNYNVNYNVSNILPSTNATFNGINWTSGLNSKNIGTSNGCAAVITNLNSGFIDNFDVSFNASSQLASYVSSNNIGLIGIRQTYNFGSESNNLVVNSTNQTFTDAIMYADANNINLAQLVPSGQDIKINLLPKLFGTDIQFNRNNNLVSVIVDPSNSNNNYLLSQKNNVNICGDIMYDIMTLPLNTNFNMNIKLYSNSPANTTASLANSIDISCNASSYYTKITYTNSEFTTTVINTVTQAPTTIAVSNTNSNYILKSFSETETLNITMPLYLSGYGNLLLSIQGVNQITTYYKAFNNSTSLPLPDNVIKTTSWNYNQGYSQPSSLKPFRTFSYTGLTTSASLSTNFTLQISDLFTFNAVVQIYNNNQWTNVSNYAPADPIFDNASTLTISSQYYSQGTANITFAVDLNDDAVMGNYTDNGYSLHLSNTPGQSSFNVSSYLYTPSTFNNFDLGTWGGPYSAFFPSGGQNLNFKINTVLTPSSNPAQSLVTIQILDSSNTNILATLVSNYSLISDFNIIVNPNGTLFEIQSVIGDVNPQTTTTYALSTSQTYTKLDNGVCYVFSQPIQTGNYLTATLNGDIIRSSLYSSYAGAYSGIYKEIDISNGLLIGNSNVSRTITLNYYRGVINAFSTVQTSETVTLTRTPATIKLQIDVNNQIGNTITYSNVQNFGTLYNGLSVTANNLTSVTPNKSFGNLGLDMSANYSMLDNSIIPYNASIAIPINLTFGSYLINVINPHSSVLDVSNQVIFTNAYTLMNYKQQPGISPFVSSRIVVYETGNYEIYYGVPVLRFYKSPNFLGNITAGPWTSIANLDFDVLSVGTLLPLSNSPYAPLTPIFVQTSILIPQGTYYVACPPPQFSLTATNYNLVNTIPYTPNVLQTTTRYCDIDVCGNNMFPFEGIFGLNDLELSFTDLSMISFENLKFDPDNGEYSFDIKSNIVSLDLYLTKTDTLIQNVYNGNIYDMVDSSFVSAAFNGHIIDFSFCQTLLPITGNLLNEPSANILKTNNLIINGLPFFATGDSSINFYAGDSTSLITYSYSTSTSNNNPYVNVKFQKYVSDIGINFTNFPELYDNNSIRFLPTSKYTYEFAINNNDGTTDIGQNVVDFFSLLSDASFSIQWTLDNNFNPSYLNLEDEFLVKLNLISNTIQGKDLLTQLLTVSKDYPTKVTLLSNPDLFQLRNGNGTPIYRVTYNGIVITPMVVTQAITLNPPSTINTGNNLNTSYYAYSVLNNMSV